MDSNVHEHIEMNTFHCLMIVTVGSLPYGRDQALVRIEAPRYFSHVLAYFLIGV